MEKVILKSNAARIVILKNIKAKGVIVKLTIKPMVNDNAYQAIEQNVWDLYKNQPLVKKYLKTGEFVIMNPDQLEKDDEVIDLKAKTVRQQGDILVKGREAVNSEITAALEAGNIDEVLEKYPVLADAINKMVDAAVAEKTKIVDATGDGNDTKDPPIVAETVDAVMAGLKEGFSADEAKDALKAYVDAKKLDVNFGNCGVPKIIEKIKEAENGD